MKNVFSWSAVIGAATMAAMSITPAHAAVVGPMSVAPDAESSNLVEKVGRWHRRRVGIAAGLITLGVIGAIAADRAHSRRYNRRHNYRDNYRRRCNRWRRRCNRGNDRACWKFDTRC